MSDYVFLYIKRNRGWPVPEDSWGLGSMFGDDGWCRSCGIPLREQSGPLTLKRTGISPPSGAWVPNWIFDTVCCDDAVATRIGQEFVVDLREIAWKGASPGRALQIVVPTLGAQWFDRDSLRELLTAEHGTAGESCTECGIWRWMPIASERLPPLIIDPGDLGADIVASPGVVWLRASVVP